MRLWIDDIRNPPEDFDVHVRTAKEAIDLLSKRGVTIISLDHDLGEEGSGYDVARYIEKQAFLGEIPPLLWFIHSANPVGKRNMEMALANAERFWQQTVSPE